MLGAVLCEMLMIRDVSVANAKCKELDYLSSKLHFFTSLLYVLCNNCITVNQLQFSLICCT